MKQTILFLLFSTILQAQSLPKNAQKDFEIGKIISDELILGSYGISLLNQGNDTAYYNYFLAYPNDQGSYTSIKFRWDKQEVLGTVIFDSTQLSDNAIVDESDRPFFENELEYFLTTKAAYDHYLESNPVKEYDEVAYYFIPYINDDERFVYLMTIPTGANYLVLGNDAKYIISDKYEVEKVEVLHQTMDVLEFQEKMTPKQIVRVNHNHGDDECTYFSPTDIASINIFGNGLNIDYVDLHHKNRICSYNSFLETYTSESPKEYQKRKDLEHENMIPNCLNVHEGTFVFSSDNNTLGYIIHRNDTAQFEYEIGTGLLVYFDLKWSDECSYILGAPKVLKNPKNVEFEPGIDQDLKFSFEQIFDESYIIKIVIEEDDSNPYYMELMRTDMKIPGF